MQNNYNKQQKAKAENLDIVNPNTVWKVVNGCKRIVRELNEGKTLPTSLQEPLEQALFIIRQELLVLEETYDTSRN